VSHAEEIAFNDPPGGPAEQLILNQHLRRMLRYSRMSAFQRFIQQVGSGLVGLSAVFHVLLLLHCLHMYLFQCFTQQGGK
jgi:hypothetical protein